LNSIDVVFYSKKNDGILLYAAAEASSNATQFFGIKIQNSYVHFSYLINGKHESLMYKIKRGVKKRLLKFKFVKRLKYF
jgi:hypothetical protein